MNFFASRLERILSSDLLKENEEKSLTSCPFFGKQTTKLFIHFVFTPLNWKKIPQEKKESQEWENK
jgi:hypothetical protein